MFKRLFIGLVAVGLSVIFMTEAANAIVVRRLNTVENTHECIGTDPCVGADSVTDTLYGWNGASAICTMTGSLVCESFDTGICTNFINNAPLSTDSFTAGALFDFQANKAQDRTSLAVSVGQGICEDLYPDSTFTKFWPDIFLAYSVYTDNDEVNPFPNIKGTEKTYELFEICTRRIPTALEPDVYDCLPLDERPHLPCCGEENELNVNIVGSGQVTSVPDGINCQAQNEGDCSETYGTTPGSDGCPEVVLTAKPVAVTGANYVFTGWSDNCTPTPVTENTCTVAPATPAALVTATFESDSFLLTVTLNSPDSNDRVRIFSPSGIFFEETLNNICDREVCTVWVDAGVTVVLKKQGDSIEWGGYCSGVPNDNLNCAVPMTGPQEAIVYFDGVPE